MIQKILTFALLTLTAFLFTAAAHAGPKLEHCYLTSEFAVPHNEPVIGDYVARYRAQAVAEVAWGRVTWEPRLTAWGVNTWRNSEQVGHFPESFANSDWSIEAVRLSTTQTLSLRLTDYLHLTTEYYMPFDRSRWGGHGLERHYYWLTGFKFGF